MDWKKEIGPWDFKKSLADTRYNEGTHIATKENPVWIMPTHGAPITSYHTPCGYWLKEYVGPDIYTSGLYPLEDFGYLDFECIVIDGNLRAQPKDSGSVNSSGASILSGNLEKDFFLIEYKNWPVENVDSSGCDIIDGLLELDFVLVEYENWPPEAVDSSGATIISGELDDRLIKYTDWPEEKITSSGATITTGVLE